MSGIGVRSRVEQDLPAPTAHIDSGTRAISINLNSPRFRVVDGGGRQQLSVQCPRRQGGNAACSCPGLTPRGELHAAARAVRSTDQPRLAPPRRSVDLWYV